MKKDSYVLEGGFFRYDPKYCNSCGSKSNDLERGLCKKCRSLYNEITETSYFGRETTIKTNPRKESIESLNKIREPIIKYKEYMLTPKDDSDLEYNIIKSFKLFIKSCEKQPSKNLIRLYKILSKLGGIFRSNANSQIFVYMIEKGAATAWIILNDLNIPEASVYRALKYLRTSKFIKPAIKTSKRIIKSKGGPRSTVWAIIGASDEEISNALQRHYKMLSPKYIVAEDVAQKILDEYLIKRNIEEITFREILIKVKELKIPFRSTDVANLTEQVLRDQGIKVWR